MRLKKKETLLSVNLYSRRDYGRHLDSSDWKTRAAKAAPPFLDKTEPLFDYCVTFLIEDIGNSFMSQFSRKWQIFVPMNALQSKGTIHGNNHQG